MSAGKKILEKDIEAYLRDQCMAQGWNPKKNISDPIRGGTSGFPDQTIVLPYPNTLYVECKAPNTWHAWATTSAQSAGTGSRTWARRGAPSAAASGRPTKRRARTERA